MGKGVDLKGASSPSNLRALIPFGFLNGLPRGLCLTMCWSLPAVCRRKGPLAFVVVLPPTKCWRLSDIFLGHLGLPSVIG